MVVHRLHLPSSVLLGFLVILQVILLLEPARVSHPSSFAQSATRGRSNARCTKTEGAATSNSAATSNTYGATRVLMSVGCLRIRRKGMDTPCAGDVPLRKPLQLLRGGGVENTQGEISPTKNHAGRHGSGTRYCCV